MQKDPYFQVEILAATENPQRLIYAAMHQDYSSGFVASEASDWPSEQRCGEIAVNRLLKGGRGHWGCCEHPSFTFNAGYFPHSVVVQARTHRIASFDVQSMRYTSKQFFDVAEGNAEVESAFYLRPAGEYTDRQGTRYRYTEDLRKNDIALCFKSALQYTNRVKQWGWPEEHARDLLYSGYRQHFVFSMNLRSLLHFLDLRYKKDAQLEIQQLCHLIWPYVQNAVPEIASWYETNRLGKARLAP